LGRDCGIILDSRRTGGAFIMTDARQGVTLAHRTHDTPRDKEDR
jgi:hypothetical protein